MQFSYDIEPVLSPLRRTSKTFLVCAAALLALTLFGAYLWVHELVEGVPKWGMNRFTGWGISISTFVFYVSISLAGTLMSAALRLVGAEWRRPISRSAEVITVIALVFAVISILQDMGRPDRLFKVLTSPQPYSPIIWDVVVINGYLLFSLAYLYLPLIPDLAHLRDKGVGYPRLYRLLACGYTGTKGQRKLLHRLELVATACIVPFAVAVHTVTAYIFATTLQPMWHSAIYGPFFIFGALYTGTALIVIIAALLRWCMGLQDFFKDAHFRILAWVLFAGGCIFTYFLVCIYLVDITGQEPHILEVIEGELWGEYSWAFWSMMALGVFIPLPILLTRWGRTPVGAFVASIPVFFALWLERYLIVIPPLSHPRLSWPVDHYVPTWQEWTIMFAGMACFAFLYLMFIKLFPIIPLAEVEKGFKTARTSTQRMLDFLPGDQKALAAELLGKDDPDDSDGEDADAASRAPEAAAAEAPAPAVVETDGGAASSPEKLQRPQPDPDKLRSGDAPPDA